MCGHSWTTLTFGGGCVCVQGLKVIDFQQSDYMRTLETAISQGKPVVLQNIQEKIDPSLDPVLTKSTVRVGQWPV
jgi:dynein heavy chain